ncbi:MAG: GTP cyclohydrolase I FolE [Dehalococcoidia bacterium]|nr:GTP cyclohydrolase I FolE [Dehalococcoidia bacterium]
MVASRPYFDRDRMMAAVRELIAAAGLDVNAEGLIDTPRRVTDMYRELFAGIERNPMDDLQVTFNEHHDEMVIVKDIPFYSLCEHHFVPFFGVAHIGYLPNGRVVGLSKLARVLETFARRPSVQERLTDQVADTLMQALEPRGVAVVIKAEHLCMTMRGVKKPGALTVTSANRGQFRTDTATRLEFLNLIENAR